MIKIVQIARRAAIVRKFYQRMGNVKGPSVVSKVIVAFVLPIVVFIFSLVGFGKLLGNKIDSPKLATVAIFALSVIVTLIFVWISSLLSKKLK